MADIAVDDAVNMHGYVTGKVIEVTNTEIEKFVVVEYTLGKDVMSTIRNITNLVEVEANVFQQQGGGF